LNVIETHIEDNNRQEMITGSYSFLITLSYLLLLLTEKGDTLYLLKCTDLPVSWNRIFNMAVTGGKMDCFHISRQTRLLLCRTEVFFQGDFTKTNLEKDFGTATVSLIWCVSDG